MSITYWYKLVLVIATILESAPAVIEMKDGSPVRADNTPQNSPGNATYNRFYNNTNITTTQTLQQHKHYNNTNITTTQTLQQHKHYNNTNITTTQTLQQHKHYNNTNITTTQTLQQHKHYNNNNKLNKVIFIIYTHLYNSPPCLSSHYYINCLHLLRSPSIGNATTLTHHPH